jgi:hypothetical protein
MKKLFFFLLLVAGVAAAVMVVRRRSEGSFEDTWDSLADIPGKIRDAGTSAA